MNQYIGKICPFCKTAFKEGDDIVVCSQCDMPHHKACWIENQGCTTFGCAGTMKSVDGSVNAVTSSHLEYDDPPQTKDYVFCTHCGKKNAASYSFCYACGTRLTTNPSPAQTMPPANPFLAQTVPPIDDTVIQLIGPQADYYVCKFHELKMQNKKTSWNWPAFLVTPYWLMYRKMYAYGLGFMGAGLMVALIGSIFLSLLFFIAYIVLGIFANYIYMTDLERRARQIHGMPEPFRTMNIVKNSGVDTTALILSIVGYVFLVLFFTLISLFL